MRITHTEAQGIIWQDNLASSHQNRLYSRVANVDEIACHDCARLLKTIALNERWYYLSYLSRYYCCACFRVARPGLCKQLQKKNAPQHKMPRPLCAVMRQIEAHPDFLTLPPLDRAEYEGAISLRTQCVQVGEQNAFIRQMWQRLYENEAQ